MKSGHRHILTWLLTLLVLTYTGASACLPVFAAGKMIQKQLATNPAAGEQEEEDTGDAEDEFLLFCNSHSCDMQLTGPNFSFRAASWKIPVRGASDIQAPPPETLKA